MSPSTPTGAVTSGSGVMTSRTRRLVWSVSKRMSRLVTMPTRTPSASTTGAPEMRYRPDSASTWARVSPGEQVTGLVIIPDSERLTRSTWPACSSAARLRCRMPTPPARAMAMAMRASVTVSMALETSGMASRMPRVSREDVSTSAGTTSEAPGTSRTSS